MEVAFRNPLKVPLELSDLSLLWEFTPKDFSGPGDGVDGEPVSNEEEALRPGVRARRCPLVARPGTPPDPLLVGGSLSPLFCLILLVPDGAEGGRHRHRGHPGV